jgi:hypothetical protein
MVVIPSASAGDAATLDEAKTRFQAAWEGLKEKQSPQKLAQVYAATNWANRPDRNRQ